MDIVYLLKNDAVNDELTYSLRSLKNIEHDKVFLVGGCPKNIRKEKVVHIPIAQGNNKYRNTALGLETACNDERVSNDFILMNDDFFILDKVRKPDIELNLCRGTIKDVLADYIRRYGVDANSYIISMRQTMIFLQDLGIEEPLSYELHIPIVINKKKFLEMIKIPYFNSLQAGHQRSIYGNLYLKDSVLSDDVKVLRDYYLPITNHRFLSSEDSSWPRVKTYIGRIFREKSIYEI